MHPLCVNNANHSLRIVRCLTHSRVEMKQHHRARKVARSIVAQHSVVVVFGKVPLDFSAMCRALCVAIDSRVFTCFWFAVPKNWNAKRNRC